MRPRCVLRNTDRTEFLTFRSRPSMLEDVTFLGVCTYDLHVHEASSLSVTLEIPDVGIDIRSRIRRHNRYRR